jgi:hypothetical protein
LCVCFFKFVAILLWSCKRNTCKFWNNFFAREFFGVQVHSSTQIDQVNCFTTTVLKFPAMSLISIPIWDEHFLLHFPKLVFVVCALCTRILCVSNEFMDKAQMESTLTFRSIMAQSWICKSFMTWQLEQRLWLGTCHMRSTWSSIIYFNCCVNMNKKRALV